MGAIGNILAPVKIPRGVIVRQHFANEKISAENLPAHIRGELRNQNLLEQIRPNQRVGITAGSRGIANIALVIRELSTIVREAGAVPYVIPCMGSHGGASAEGQIEILSKLGITEEYIGASILSSMEVVCLGKSKSGVPVYVDKNAWEMDSLIIINRIKPHTAFRGAVESGLQKMLVIGVGKQKGAETCHNAGFGEMYQNITEMSNLILEKMNISFAIGLVENAYDETFLCVALPKHQIKKKEPELLEVAKARLPKIPFRELDVLVIDEIGKNIAGSGMDTNVTGRYATPYITGGPRISKIVTLDLTDESKGNATGLGHSDFTTRRCVDKMNFEATYPNALTSTVTTPSKIPLVMPNDILAVKAGIMTCNSKTLEQVKLVRIRNTLKLEQIWISEGLIQSAQQNSTLEIMSDLEEMAFDANGNLF